MATNIPLTGNFRVTAEYKRKGNWAAGWHTGIDLVGDEKIYATCSGVVTAVATDNAYGNYIVVKSNEDGKFHWFCHLEKMNVKNGDKVERTSVIGIMGNTGNSTGKHLHYEIRNLSNKYADTINPADYMGIPNRVGNYNTNDYKIKEQTKEELKTLARNTNLRNAPTIKGTTATTYLANTTLFVLEPGVANADGFTWDKVRIRTNGKEGYMINKNYA